VIDVDVQTWERTPLRRYWAPADDLGFARITYGDGLGPGRSTAGRRWGRPLVTRRVLPLSSRR
jgi:hypothetical protein